MPSARLLRFTLLLAGACGGGALTPDAGAPDAGFPIARPALPIFTPCPAGWREVVEDGVTLCDPWPEGGPADCPEDQAHFPGEPGCRLVGSACPAGAWPEGLPAGRPIRYVLPGAPAGGDGSMATPFATIAEALAAPPADLIVALAKGTYTTVVDLPGGVTLWGACPGETRVASNVYDDFSGTITVQGAGAEVRNLTVSGQRSGVWVEGAGRSVHLAGVIVVDTILYGVEAWDGASVTGDDLAIRRTRDLSGFYGYGMEAGGVGGTLIDATRVVIEGSRGAGVNVTDAGSTVTLADVAVRDTFGSDQALAAFAVMDGSLTVRRAALDDNVTEVVSAYDNGTILFEDVVAASPSFMVAVQGEWGIHITLNRTVWSGHRYALLAKTMTGITATDLLVRDNFWIDAISFQRAICEAQLSSSLSITRGLFVRNPVLALTAGDDGSRIDLEDVTVSDAMSSGDGFGGRGLELYGGATGEGTRLAFHRCRDVAVATYGAGSTLTLHDVEISDTAERGCVTGTCPGEGAGIGLGAYVDSSMDVTGFVVDRGVLAGIQLARGGMLDLHRGEIAENPIGVNIQSEGFDVHRLLDGVIFRDNGNDLDQGAAYVPNATPPPGL